MSWNFCYSTSTVLDQRWHCKQLQTSWWPWKQSPTRWAWILPGLPRGSRVCGDFKGPDCRRVEEPGVHRHVFQQWTGPDIYSSGCTLDTVGIGFRAIVRSQLSTTSMSQILCSLTIPPVHSKTMSGWQALFRLSTRLKCEARTSWLQVNQITDVHWPLHSGNS